MAAYRVEWPAWADWYASSGSPVRGQVGSVLGGGYISGLSADAGYVEWQVVTAAGTYTLICLFAKAAGCGMFQMSIDGVDVGALTDGYAAGTSWNNVYTATGLTLTEGDAHTVRMTSNGKNVSASAYNLYPQWFSLERTGA